MQNDDRLKAAARIASEKLRRDGKLAAERLVGGTDQLTASELMNELQASGGTNSKVLSELIGRHGHIVVNELYRAHVQRHDVDIIANLVWDRVWAISMKPLSEKGAWDYHRHRTVGRKRRSAFEDMVRIQGEVSRRLTKARGKVVARAIEAAR
jgi:hypothetical protein